MSCDITISLSAEEVARIKLATEVDNENEAVAKAVREFLRVAGLRELKAASGKVDYMGAGEEMEALEAEQG